MPSKIEWCDETWNPIIGCSKVSAGCKNCYAERMAWRQWCMRPGCEYGDVLEATGRTMFRIWAGNPSAGLDESDEKIKHRWNGKTAFVPSALDKPLHWRKPRRIFVCSMGDLFHETVPYDWQEQVFRVMWKTPRHTYMLLTKRIDDACLRIRRLQSRFVRRALPNVWLGVTAENQATADARIPVLMQIPAAKRFVSVEPMLGPVHMPHYWMDPDGFSEHDGEVGLDWVICGAETGPGKRPMENRWALDLARQCSEGGVPFLFKKDSTGRRELDGRVWDEVPPMQ